MAVSDTSSLTADPFGRRFPLWAFHPGRRTRLAVRLGALAEYRLARECVRPLRDKPQADFLYVSMVGRSHWLLLRESLRSLHRTWSQLPEFLVISDGTWQPEEFRAHFAFWPRPFSLLTRDEVIAKARRTGPAQLAELAVAHPLGVKLAAIVQLAREQQILFTDSDVLWFSDPAPTLKALHHVNGPSALVEQGASANPFLAQAFAPELLTPPGINTGCVWLRGELCERDLFNAVLTQACRDPAHEFNEQTIIGIAGRHTQASLGASFCLVDFADAFALRLRRPGRAGYHARHYVRFMRHQFFRDAIAHRET